MNNFIEVPFARFASIPINSYIKWLNPQTGEMTAGAYIKKIRVTKAGRGNWHVKGGNSFKYTLYWDTIKTVSVQRSVFYDILEERVSLLAEIIEFTIAESGLNPKYALYKKILAGRSKVNSEKKMQRTTSLTFKK